jgi:RNA polymerase sigma-70 factor (ECF subfamily)
MENARMPQQSMEELAASACQGDREAFAALVAAVEGRLTALLEARIGAHLRGALPVEDARQETLLRAFQAIGRFRWQGEDSFLRWLAGIAERVILEAARRSESRGTLELTREPDAGDPSAATRLRREERFARLERALSCLSPEQREVVLLARRDGLTVREVAQRVGRSLDATKQILSRSLKRLRSSLGDTESLGLPDCALPGDGGGDAAR